MKSQINILDSNDDGHGFDSRNEGIQFIRTNENSMDKSFEVETKSNIVDMTTKMKNIEV